MPMTMGSGFHYFEVCQKEKCVEGGRFSTFGGPGWDGSKSPINKKNHYLREEDITDVIKKQGLSLKSLVVRRTNSSRSVLTTSQQKRRKMVPVKNLPEPVILVEQKGLDGEWRKHRVILNPKVKRSYYGDLLDKYSVV